MVTSIAFYQNKSLTVNHKTQLNKNLNISRKNNMVNVEKLFSVFCSDT